MNIRVDDAPLPLPSIEASAVIAPRPSEGTAFGVLGGISFAHMLNDMIQSLILAIYPVLNEIRFHLELHADRPDHAHLPDHRLLLQPLVGMVTDRRPMPYSLPVEI